LIALEPASPREEDRDVAQGRARERARRRHHEHRRLPFSELMLGRQLRGKPEIFRKGFSFQSPGIGFENSLRLCMEEALFGWAVDVMCAYLLAVA
jgi:hypothetical protein